MKHYGPDAADYHMHRPDDENQRAVTAAAQVFVRFFELAADIQRREADRERVEAESRRRIEQFAVEMEQLDKRLDGDHALALNLQNHLFEAARDLVARGHPEQGLEVLRLLAAPRQSLVQQLIAYHEKVTFAGTR